ncbi:fluoride efflux transporter FluC [Bacillus weihaiensis]|uniref:fluoride efflux transporter FluC n=1 Tax=Bacillus weihaiensis TaxID=1547283 RepID=UPI0023533712|nr:CrcB family protein [Bacillus weihaiensis]
MKDKVINTLLVALGGSFGSMSRYAVSIPILVEPLSTFIVNIVGSFILGYVSTYSKNTQLKLFMGTGFCGGFTTMSTFSLELTSLPIHFASGYLIATLLCSLILAYLGIWLGTLMKGSHDHD